MSGSDPMPSNDNWHAASSHNEPNPILWVPRQVGASNQNALMGETYKAAGGGDGPSDGPKSIFALDVKRDLQILKWATPLLFTSFVGGWLHFNSEVKDVRKEISDIRTLQATQTANSDFIRETLNRIEGRLDEKKSLPNSDIETASSPRKVQEAAARPQK